MRKHNILAIDFGGMSVKYYLFNNSTELASHISDSKPLLGGFDALIDDIKRQFTAMQRAHGPIHGIAMSFNSPVLDGSRVRWGHIHGFWEYTDIKALIEKAGIIKRDKIAILNDGKAAGYAEIKIGAAAGEKNAVLLTYGTAIGGAAFINGEVVNGPFGLGAELSNPLLGYDGESLSSLKLWTDFGSMSFLINKYRALTNEELTGKAIFDRFDRSEKAARVAVEALYRGIAIHVFSCCYIYGPSSIVIGGGLSNRPSAADEIMSFVKQIESLKRLSFPAQVKLAKAGNKAGALGAYLYFLDTVK